MCNVSYEDRTEERVINVLCTTELWKCEPEYNYRLKKVVESYPSEPARQDTRPKEGDLRSQYKIVLDQNSTTLKKENTTQYVNHCVSSDVPVLSIAFILSYATPVNQRHASVIPGNINPTRFERICPP